MGICSSCLGLDRRRPQGNDTETRGLLSDDPYQGGRYGTDSSGPAQRTPFQPDTESVRREREVLDGICHAMSDNVIDVFTAQQPQVSGLYGPDPSRPTTQHSNGNRDEPQRADMSLKTIKKGRAGPVFSHHGQGASGFKAVQDAIG